MWSCLMPLTHGNPAGPSEGRLVLGSEGGLPQPWQEVGYGRQVGEALLFDSRMIHMGVDVRLVKAPSTQVQTCPCGGGVHAPGTTGL